MGSIYSSYGAAVPNNSPYGPDRQFVIPQITIPSGIGNIGAPRYEPLTANGKDAAYRMYTPPGVRVPIFDEVEEVFYYKETDANGNIVAFDVYDYKKRQEAPPPEYVTKDAFDSLLSDFNKLKEAYENGQSVRSQGHSRPYNNGSGNKPAADNNSK